MKQIFTLFALTLLLTVGCALSSFTRTGTATYPPLPETAQVDVILRSIPTYSIEPIGVVRVQGGTTGMQIEKAQKIARENGGNVIVLAEVGIAYNSDGSAYEIRTFEVARKVEEPVDNTPKGKTTKKK